MNDYQYFIDRYKALIEQRIGWGDSRHWQSQDFYNLCTEIFAKTGVLLSASTLKRVWGKVKYDSTPNLSTLDALARYADFANWRSFCNAQEAPLGQDNRDAKKFRYRLPMLLAFTVAMAFLVGFILTRKPSKTLRYDNISFSSKPVTRSVPNTVIFAYDASNSNADSVFIQQNWDERRRFRVDKEKHEYASTYYLPGYYRAKLVLNDSVVKEHDVFIESDWMGVLEKSPIPTYLPRKVYLKNGLLGIQESDIHISSNDFRQEVPTFLLTRVNKDMQVPSENFDLSLSLQNTFSGVNAPCRKASITLLGTKGVIRLPLSAPGCVGDLLLILGDRVISGNTRNLSGFGVDFSRTVQLTCSVSGGKITVGLDRKIAFQDTFAKGVGNIVGVRIAFKGTGIIRDFELTENL